MKIINMFSWHETSIICDYLRVVYSTSAILGKICYGSVGGYI